MRESDRDIQPHLLRLVATIELKLGWPRAHGASAESGGRAECGWLERPTQNPTLKLRTYQSYEHTHTQIQNANTRLYPGLSLFTYLSPFQLQIHVFVAFFFLLHAWLNETPITFWTLGRICSTAAMQLRICLTVCWTTNGYGSTTWMKNLYKWRIIQNQPECELPVQTHDLLRDY